MLSERNTVWITMINSSFGFATSTVLPLTRYKQYHRCGGSASRFLSSKQSDICRISQPEVWPSVWPDSYNCASTPRWSKHFWKQSVVRLYGGSLYHWHTANIYHGSVQFSYKHYWQLVRIFGSSLALPPERSSLFEFRVTRQATIYGRQSCKAARAKN